MSDINDLQVQFRNTEYNRTVPMKLRTAESNLRKGKGKIVLPRPERKSVKNEEANQ